MRTYRDSLKVGEAERSVVQKAASGTPRYPPDVFLHATEVRAVKDRRHPDESQAPVIAHAGEAIDDDFGVSRCGVGQRRLDECERGGCDDPMNDLHDYVPPWRRAGCPTEGTIVRICHSDAT